MEVFLILLILCSTGIDTSFATTSDESNEILSLNPGSWEKGETTTTIRPEPDANFVYIEETYCTGEIMDVYLSLQDAKDDCSNDNGCKCVYDHHSAGTYFFTTNGHPTHTYKESGAWSKKTSCVGDLCLVGGDPTSGNLYIRDQPVCNKYHSSAIYYDWDIEDAQVACKEMGFSGAFYQINSYGYVPDTFIMSDVNCTGSESRIEDCPHSESDEAIHDCSQYEGAGVICVTEGFDQDFVPISSHECPCNYDDDAGCAMLPDCSYSMSENDLCDAEHTLPDGNQYYYVYNCPTRDHMYHVFRYNGDPDPDETTTPRPDTTTRNPRTTTYRPYTTTRKPTTTHRPYTTTRKPTTTHRPYTTTRKPTTHRPYTTTHLTATTTHQQLTTYPPETEHCYGHFTYKEDHNIIIDGEDDRHKDALECELACTMITGCRFWKYTMEGKHTGYCELNRGTPLNEGEVIGQRNVKLVNDQDGNGSYCWFPPNDEEPSEKEPADNRQQ